MSGGDVNPEHVTILHELNRLSERALVEGVGGLRRSGAIEAGGYRKKPPAALVDLTGEDHARARRLVETADAVCRVGGEPARLPQVAARFAAGETDVEHVAVAAQILRSTDAARLAPETWQQAEGRIAQLATGCTLRELRIRGEQVIADLTPASGDEEPAAKPNELRLTRLPGGGGKISGRISDSTDFTVVETLLGALSAPRDADDHRPQAQRLGDALVEAARFVTTHGANPDLPTGGNRPQLIVHIQEKDLHHDLRRARADSGVPLDPAAARALACDSEIIPMVLGGRSRPLDVGRTARIVPAHIRHALRVRDGGCAHPGCDRIPSWCEAHHIKEWSKNGATSLDNLVLLCTGHHRLHHSAGWNIRMARDGLPEFIPPVFIDPERRPRRHARMSA